MTGEGLMACSKNSARHEPAQSLSIRRACEGYDLANPEIWEQTAALRATLLSMALIVFYIRGAPS